MPSFVVRARRPAAAPLLALLLAGLPLSLAPAVSAGTARVRTAPPRPLYPHVAPAARPHQVPRRSASPHAAMTITVTSTNDDDGSAGVNAQGNAPTLRDALGAAQPGDTVDLSQLTGTITLQYGPLSIGSQGTPLTGLIVNGPAPATGTLVIDGNASSLGASSTSVFIIGSGSAASMTDLTIQDGSAVDGGGINNAGSLSLTGCTVVGNSANFGGGLYSTGTLALTGCTVTANGANFGGGLYSTGTLNMTGCTVSQNSALGDATGITAAGGTASNGGGGGGGAGVGGGLYSDGSATIVASTFSNNTAIGGNGNAGGAGGDESTSPGAGGTGGGFGLKGLEGIPGGDGLGGAGAAGTATGPTTPSGGLAGETGQAGGDGDVLAGGGGGGGGGLTAAMTQQSTVTDSFGDQYKITTVQPGNGQGGAGGAGGFGGGGGGGGGVYTSGVIGAGGAGGFGGGAGGSGDASQVYSQQVSYNPSYYDTSYYGDAGGGGGGGAGLGGGIYSGASLQLTNVTLSQNTAQGGEGGAGGTATDQFGYPSGPAGNGGYGGGGYGGGVFNNQGNVTCVNCTLAFNAIGGGVGNGVTAPAAGGSLYALGGSAASALSLTNTILADSSAPGNTGTPTTVAAMDFSQSGANITDSGSGNLIQKNDTGSAGFSAGGTTGGYIGGDPLLGPLTNNGGPTQTEALMLPVSSTSGSSATPGSPAIAAGTSAGAPPTDQRGVPRPQGVNPDIGAYQTAFVAAAQTYSVYSTGTNTVSAANGLLSGSMDPYGSSETAAVATQPTHGILKLKGDGSFSYTYTPNAAGFAPTDSFTYQIKDANGALSNTATVTLNVQNTSIPATTASLTPATPNGANGWYTSSVSVTLTASDPNGAGFVAATNYTLDGGAPQTYTAGIPILVAGDLVHTLTYYSQDQSGNKDGPYTLTIKIDGTPPVTSAQTSATGSGSQVTLTASDNLSGIAGTFYTLDGSGRQTYSAGTPITLGGLGKHTLTYYSVDVAGNTEPTHSQTTSPSGQTLHTFQPGLQMIAVTEDYTGVPLASAWDAPNGQQLAFYNGGSSYTFSTSLPTPGRGAWVHPTQTVDLFDAGTAAPTTGPFTVALTGRQWNLIGNPFPNSVAENSLLVQDSQGRQYTLAQANTAGLVSSTLLTWPAGSTAYQSQGLSSALNVYQGYYIYAFQSVRLLVPVTSGLNIPPPPAPLGHPGAGRH